MKRRMEAFHTLSAYGQETLKQEYLTYMVHGILLYLKEAEGRKETPEGT